MKREDITSVFPDATKEQIDKLMGINGEDINKAKGELEQAKKDLTKAQADLAAAKSGDPEELQKAKDEAAQYKNELDGMKLAESLRVMRAKVAKDKGLDPELLTGDTEDACTQQADKILAFANSKSGYTPLPNPGEPSGSSGKTTAQQFAEWMGDF